jgi:hypothetical protein
VFWRGGELALLFKPLPGRCREPYGVDWLDYDMTARAKNDAKTR